MKAREETAEEAHKWLKEFIWDPIERNEKLLEYFLEKEQAHTCTSPNTFPKHQREMGF